MASRAEHAELLMVKLSPKLKRRLKRAAAAQRTDMSKLTREAIEEHLDRLDRMSRGERLVERLRGTGTSGMTSDEIMALTRGDD